MQLYPFQVLLKGMKQVILHPDSSLHDRGEDHQNTRRLANYKVAFLKYYFLKTKCNTIQQVFCTSRCEWSCTQLQVRISLMQDLQVVGQIHFLTCFEYAKFRCRLEHTFFYKCFANKKFKRFDSR